MKNVQYAGAIIAYALLMSAYLLPEHFNMSALEYVATGGNKGSGSGEFLYIEDFTVDFRGNLHGIIADQSGIMLG